MKKKLNVENKGLSIQELEERYEMSVVMNNEFYEADKRCTKHEPDDLEIAI